MELALGVSRCSSQSELRPPRFLPLRSVLAGSVFRWCTWIRSPPLHPRGSVLAGLPALSHAAAPKWHPPSSFPPMCAGIDWACLTLQLRSGRPLRHPSRGSIGWLLLPVSRCLARDSPVWVSIGLESVFLGVPPARVSGRRFLSMKKPAARSRPGKRGIMFGSLLCYRRVAYHGRVVGPLMRHGSGASSGTVPAVSVESVASGRSTTTLFFFP